MEVVLALAYELFKFNCLPPSRLVFRFWSWSKRQNCHAWPGITSGIWWDMWHRITYGPALYMFIEFGFVQGLF